MTQYPEKFVGYQSPDLEHWNQFKKNSYTPRPFFDDDVDVEIECCGVCASDMHKINGDWGETPYPLTVGHEVVGKVVKVGPKVTLAKVGQRVGVGAQIYSCLKCKECQNDNETYCKHTIDTWGAEYLDTGHITQGGYASHIRVQEFW